GAVVLRAGVHDGVKPRASVLLFDQPRIGRTTGDQPGVGHLQNLAGIRAPDQFVGLDAPRVGNDTGRGENLMGFKGAGRGRTLDLTKPVSLVIALVGGICPILAGHGVPAWLAGPRRAVAGRRRSTSSVS